MWEGKGVSVGDQKIKSIRFPDDMIVTVEYKNATGEWY